MDFEWQSSASKTVPANLGLMGSALHRSQNLIFSSSMCMGEAATKFIMNKFCTSLRDTRARHNYISPCPMLTSCDLSFTCALISCSSVLLVNPLCRNCSWFLRWPFGCNHKKGLSRSSAYQQSSGRSSSPNERFPPAQGSSLQGRALPSTPGTEDMSKWLTLSLLLLPCFQPVPVETAGLGEQEERERLRKVLKQMGKLKCPNEVREQFLFLVL